jgi:hypothetical protein
MTTRHKIRHRQVADSGPCLRSWVSESGATCFQVRARITVHSSTWNMPFMQVCNLTVRLSSNNLAFYGQSKERLVLCRESHVLACAENYRIMLSACYEGIRMF